jgi:DNA-K related protein/Hsp70 protein
VSEPATDVFEQPVGRYIIGIDLGTTNSAVAFVDTQAARPAVESLRIEQWVDFGTREARELLPSFHYQPTLPEKQSFAKPTGNDSSAAASIVGSLARDRGLQLPGRQISSAKSWLCHEGVNRRSPILPWQCDDDVEKLSPVEASSRYLEHIRKCWDAAFRSHPLADQDVVLTLPASFDQVARQLTVEAAAMAGLPRVLLIEEPQAAFYAWLNLHHDGWEKIVTAGQTILVCDIGGGTTDFTLIRVRAAHESADGTAAKTLLDRDEQTLSLHRVAVGQHLILGGDNLDLALAKFAEKKLAAGKQLPPRVWDALRQACRVTKETLLGKSSPPQYTIHLPGTGSRLVSSGSQVEITADEVQAVILDGFFPQCELTDRPLTQRTGFQEFGLPFAHDPAITKHLAAFLWEHRSDGRADAELNAMSEVELAKPDWILFNGGVLESSQIKQRIVVAIAKWFAGTASISPDWRIGVLDGDRLDVAVSRGAAYFGQVRRGEGVRIEAKLARSYYVTVSQSPARAVCVIPGSASPGDQFRLDRIPFELTVGQPVQFPISYSSTRLADRASECYDLDEQNFSALPPIRTVLEFPGKRRQERLPVVLEAELSQIGTLQLWCAATESQQRWKLEFDIRATTETDRTANESSAAQSGIVDESVQAAARSVLEDCFGATGTLKPSQVMQSLAERLEKSRQAWPPSLLRSMWQDLMDFEAGRQRSADHETRWLNLLGYVLRPGYGLAADDWRVAQSWRVVYGRLAFATPSSRSESLILWRRLAGGFTAGQQLAVYQQVAGPLRGLLDPVRRAKGGSSVAPNELAELLRLVGSLELLPKSEKSQLGRWLLELQKVKKWSFSTSAIFWTLGRLGSRVPTYGPLNTVIDTAEVELWLEQLLVRPAVDHESTYQLALLQCARLVNDRYRDIDPGLRARVIARLKQTNAPEHYITLVASGGQLATEEATQILGESLPLGLTFP